MASRSFNHISSLISSLLQHPLTLIILTASRKQPQIPNPEINQTHTTKGKKNFRRDIEEIENWILQID